MELFDEDNPKWSHAQRYRNLGQPDKQEWIWFIILYVGALLWHALMHCPHRGIKIDYVTVGRFALIPGLWRKEGLGRGGGVWDGVGHVGGRD